MAIQAIGARPLHIDYSTRTWLFIFLSILLPFLFLSSYVRTEVSRRIVEEKEDKLFGLARQLDNHLEGTFDDILEQYDALSATRETQIAILNRELRGITDFVASGNPGVGVGYYHRKLDAIITYGPSDQFEYHVGRSIERGHQGIEVMSSGLPMVQSGQLVRGNILNCMWPVVREGEVIGYIWSNETIDHVEQQIRPIKNRLLGVSFVILIAIYISVVISTRELVAAVDHISDGLDTLTKDPSHRIAPVHGSLNRVVGKINDLLSNATFVRIYNKFLLDSVLNGVVAVDTGGTITSTNKAFHRILDRERRATRGRRFDEVFSGEMRRLIEAGVYESRLFDSKLIELRDKTFEMYSNAILDDHNSRIGVVFVFRDVTVLKRYERQLKEKERSAALGELSLHVAHEVKNPLTSVKGFTQLLGRRGVGDDKRKRYAEIVDSELNRVNHLLEELLLYGGRAPIHPEPVDMAALIADILDRHRESWPRLRFRCYVRGVDPTASVDRWKIVQVLDNVIQNSIEATTDRAHPSILVRLSGDSEHLTITVLDNGTGMPPDDIERVFQPFFTTKATGFGFGLSVCYRIIESHHGEVAIESRNGLYTKVRITLPRALESVAV